jgi:tRNA(Ile)-lysidine synthase
MKKIDEKIIRFIEEYELIEHGDKILVALSGGPDSVFLLNFLLKYKRKYGIEIGAMHVNHMIRGEEADRDEKFCKNLCLKLGVVYHTVKRNVPSFAMANKISIEEAARKIRYEELAKVKKKFSYDKIATAHNCSDNAETIFLNLIKGTGLKGLSGIPIRRENIIRPILSITKDEILKYLEKNNVHYLIDKTNLSNIYQRNFIRNELFPQLKKHLNPKIEQTLFKSSLVIKKQSAVLHSAINIISEHVVTKKKDKLEINIDELSSIDKSLWGDVIKYSVERNFKVQLSSNDCSKVISLFAKQIGKSISISNGLSAMRERSKVIVYIKTEQKKSPHVEIKIAGIGKINDNEIMISYVDETPAAYSKNKNFEYIDADKVTNKFILRYWKDGDRFYPLGLKGSKKVSDFLNDQKVSVFEKRKQLVLTNNKKIVWVVGHRIDNRFKITDKTRKVLQLCLK